MFLRFSEAFKEKVVEVDSQFAQSFSNELTDSSLIPPVRLYTYEAVCGEMRTTESPCHVSPIFILRLVLWKLFTSYEKHVKLFMDCLHTPQVSDSGGVPLK